MWSHGMTNTDTYRVWRRIRERCNSKGGKYYKDYGGRGIIVCNRWNDFKNFYIDMHESYIDHIKKFGKKNTSIDRINCDGNYEPNNCRWATPIEQANNRRKTLRFCLDGKLYTIRELADIYNFTYKILFNRLVVHKWPVERSITLPIQKNQYE